MRDSLLSGVRVILERFAESRDPRIVLAPEALAEVIDLLHSVRDPAHDIEVARAAGLLLFFRSIFGDSGSPESGLNEALGLLESVYNAQPETVPAEIRAYFEHRRGSLLIQEAMKTGQLEPLNEAISMLKRSLEVFPAHHPVRASPLSDLSGALWSRFKQTGVIADLDGAVTAARDCIDLTPPADAVLAGRVASLSAFLWDRFRLTNAGTDLDATIAATQEALRCTPADHPDRAARATNLAYAVRGRFVRAGDNADLDTAVLAWQIAVDATLPKEDRADLLSNLSIDLCVRAERTGSLTDFNAAVTAARESVEVTLAGHPEYAARLFKLSSILLAKAERTGEPPDLDAAAHAAQEAVNATPIQHPHCATHLSVLSRALYVRFRHMGSSADLDAAVTAAWAGANATPAGDSDCASRLSSLASTLLVRGRQAGRLADLDAAVTAAQEAVDCTPAAHPDRVGRLSGLFAALWFRSELTGGLADLNAAVSATQEALDVTPAGDPSRNRIFSNLAGALWSRSERTRTLPDLDAAITAAQEAIDALPVKHPDLPEALSNLSIALRTRFERTGVPTDLDSAIIAAEAATSRISADDPERAGRVGVNLSIALHARFKQSGALADLDAAVGAAQKVVQSVSNDHQARAKGLMNLGTALRDRFRETGTVSDREAAIAAWREHVRLKAAPPRDRAQTARSWARAEARDGRWLEAVEGFDAAIDLLDIAAPRAQARNDQEHFLSNMAGLASEAATACLEAGLTDHAIELFERGRGVFLNQILDTRADLAPLSRQHPELAKEFISIRGKLNRDEFSEHPKPMATDPLMPKVHVVQLEARRREVANTFDGVIANIRTKRGFERFLQPLDVRELANAAIDGPVVIVNVSQFGSHALILNSSGHVEAVPLTGLTFDRVMKQASIFLDALEHRPLTKSDEQRLSDVLGWLWETLAGPVLEHLRLTSAPPTGRPWPRLWWCVSGLLSFLPLHAAGYHNTRQNSTTDTVMDRVVSSYTSTIRALVHARRSRIGYRDPGQSESILVVAMPETPDAQDLPGVEAETRMLRKLFSGRVRTLVGPEATRHAVLAALPNARLAHFSCHGVVDLSSPSASRLLLNDHLSEPLTVSDIARLHLENADLAFLSACSTANPSVLADESIHLASAFQLAGYRQVIGTLWPVNDQAAARIASEVYANMQGSEATRSYAPALHSTIQKLRNQQPNSPSKWATHIHYGV